MISITHKSNTLRKAVAGATLTVSSAATMEAIREGRVPKGDVLECSRVAGLFAVKKTSDVIPDCHPLPIEFTAVRHRMEGLDIHIEVEVHTIYKTGVEVEAMHGASVVALTMYDMLKPVDKGICIGNIRLLEKKGGKSDGLRDLVGDRLRAAVIVCSDTVAAGKKEDRAGLLIREKLERLSFSEVHYTVIPDEPERIRQKLSELAGNKTDLVIFTGGTGLSPRDHTPETILPLLDRQIPGIMETARRYGQERMPYAMLSRGIAGMLGETLVLTLPGSTRGAAESMDALFPQLLHIFAVRQGSSH
ncbi:MAG: bifunctional molybdenum cofactor biosynthesis protein MoaC/MoaB [Bacteroidia bacterium]|nr:bifunctional molybdenum cofactor biosynthesis protein MoaC/MoaB [Bacteroidia bacterium]